MMHRVSINTATGRLIESQSGEAGLDVLRENALGLGIPAANIEVKLVDDEELGQLLAACEDKAAEINRERDRRTATLFSFGGVAYQCDERSQQNITAKGAQAKFAVLAGAQANDLRWANPNVDFGWIATDNSVTPMDAQTMSAFADAADLWVTSHIMAGSALKKMDPIPADYADGKWWPTV